MATEHPAVTALKVAAKLKAIQLHTMPSGHFAIYKKTKRPLSIEPLGAWMKFNEVARYFGATDKITLRQALERDGFVWPNN